jgi:hypothetical protein
MGAREDLIGIFGMRFSDAGTARTEVQAVLAYVALPVTAVSAITRCRVRGPEVGATSRR